jgi:hypothetical protein
MTGRRSHATPNLARAALVICPHKGRVPGACPSSLFMWGMNETRGAAASEDSPAPRPPEVELSASACPAIPRGTRGMAPTQ